MKSAKCAILLLMTFSFFLKGPAGEPGAPGQQGNPGVQVRIGLSQVNTYNIYHMKLLTRMTTCFRSLFQGFPGPQGPIGMPGEKVSPALFEY